MKEPGFEFKDHTADVQVHCYGHSIEDAFEQAAYSLMTTISPNLQKIKPKVEKSFQIIAEDKQALLFDFLSEFLYIFDVEGLLFSLITIKSINKKDGEYILKAIVFGEKFDKKIHNIGIEVKAITYSFMNIEETPEQVKIDVVFDI